MFIETVPMSQVVGFFENRKYVSYKSLNSWYIIDVKMHVMDGCMASHDYVKMNSSVVHSSIINMEYL